MSLVHLNRLLPYSFRPVDLASRYGIRFHARWRSSGSQAAPIQRDYLAEPYLFAINIPFGIAAVVIGMRALPHTPRSRHAFDWQSALMSAIMFGLDIAAIDSVGHGEAPLLYLSEAVIAAIACMLLVLAGIGLLLFAVRHGANGVRPGRWREQNAPLGRAVIGGLIFATASTLFFFPTVFMLVNKMKRFGTQGVSAAEPALG
jgi:hypothetical protein